MIYAAIAVAVLTFLAAIFLSRRFSKVRSAELAQAISGLRVASQIPSPGNSPKKQRQQDEAYRMLRAALGRTDGGVFVVTSSIPNEAKTTVTAALARAVARAGHQVVLVEADLRKPRLAEELGVTSIPPRGLTAAIVGQVDPEDLLINIAPGIKLLPAGAIPPNAPELLGSFESAQLIDRLRKPNRLVLLDTAPLLPASDTRELLGHQLVDLTLLVCRLRQTSKRQLGQSSQLVATQPAAMLVLTGDRDMPRAYDRYLAG